jgi:hypothetical protein
MFGADAPFARDVTDEALSDLAPATSRWDKAETIIKGGLGVIDRFFDYHIAKSQTEGEIAQAEAAREAAKSGDTSAVAAYLKGVEGKLSAAAVTPWIIGGAALVGVIMLISVTRSRRRR